MDDTTILATSDDTGTVGVIKLTKAELKEFTTINGSDKGEHMTSMIKKYPFSLVSCVLSEVRQEILMEIDSVVFKLRLRFDICCLATEERRLQQIEEDRSM